MIFSSFSLYEIFFCISLLFRIPTSMAALAVSPVYNPIVNANANKQNECKAKQNKCEEAKQIRICMHVPALSTGSSSDRDLVSVGESALARSHMHQYCQMNRLFIKSVRCQCWSKAHRTNRTTTTKKVDAATSKYAHLGEGRACYPFSRIPTPNAGG